MKALLSFILCICLFVQTPFGAVFAADTAEVDSTITELQNKIKQLQSEENSLSKQIAILDNNISLTTLKIDATQKAVVKLDGEISELIGEIDRLEQLLTKRSELVLKRIPESYKRKVAPSFGLLLLSQNFSELLHQVKYISTVQEQDAQLLFQLKATQNNFSQRRDLREQKKVQQQQLKLELETQTKELDKQKKDKQTLLTQTKSSELVYQQLLAQALAEKQALERALVESVQVGPVKQGDPIALVGNSGYPGCSTGAHLHFEVRRNNAWVNATDFLSSRDIVDQQNGGTHAMGGGSWPWPLDGNIIVTQHYGNTPYSWRYAYSGGIHTGIDMVSNTSAIIRAPADGTLYSSSQTCGSSSIIKIKYIDHGGGVISFYLHVQ